MWLVIQFKCHTISYKKQQFLNFNAKYKKVTHILSQSHMVVSLRLLQYFFFVFFMDNTHTHTAVCNGSTFCCVHIVIDSSSSNGTCVLSVFIWTTYCPDKDGFYSLHNTLLNWVILPFQNIHPSQQVLTRPVLLFVFTIIFQPCLFLS